MPSLLFNSSTQRMFWSDLGWIGIIGSERGVRFLTFGHDNRQQVQAALDFDNTRSVRKAVPPSDGFLLADCPSGFDREPEQCLESAQELLERYASGEPVDLTVLPIDLPPLTRFQQRVVATLQRVGYGKTISYRQLAEEAGSRGAARAVGNLMARNRIPLIIPCHRVIGSGGRLGGFSAPQGISMKRRLLEMEQSSD